MQQAAAVAAAAAEGSTTTTLWANAVVNLFNVLFFVVIQTFFFMFIASREIDRVVANKSKVIHSLRREMVASGMQRGVDALDHHMYQQRERLRTENVGRARALRHLHNWMLAGRWILPVALALTLALVFCIVMVKRKGHGFSYAHRVGLALVVVAYLTEVLFFLLVVERYRMLGDWEAVQLSCGLDDDEKGTGNTN